MVRVPTAVKGSAIRRTRASTSEAGWTSSMTSMISTSSSSGPRTLRPHLPSWEFSASCRGAGGSGCLRRPRGGGPERLRREWWEGRSSGLVLSGAGAGGRELEHLTGLLVGNGHGDRGGALVTHAVLGDQRGQVVGVQAA